MEKTVYKTDGFVYNNKDRKEYYYLGGIPLIIQLEEAKRELIRLDGDIDELGNAMKIEELKVNIAAQEEKTLAPDFWNSPDSSTILQQIKSMKDKVEAFSNLKKRCEDAVVLAEMGLEENDESVLEEVLAEQSSITDEIETRRIATLLSGEYDKNNAIVSFHPGAGGQHINKTDSAIRILHIPTGIVVGCQTERSQLQNKETAMKMLKAKLMEINEREKLDKIEDIKGVKTNIEWGAQIRSYVFMPYTLAKDTRTGYEDGNISAVMDGEIDGFINAYLKSQAQI